jgi:hypothetical protein
MVVDEDLDRGGAFIRASSGVPHRGGRPVGNGGTASGFGSFLTTGLRSGGDCIRLQLLFFNTGYSYGQAYFPTG